MSEITSPAKVRSAKLDNIKGVLIITVVLGHFLYAYKSYGMAEYIFKTIYFFHMPAFTLVSGYLSSVKEHMSAKPYLRLIISYIIINSIMMLYNHLVLGGAIKFLVPYYSYWYIVSLIFWRLLLQAVSSFNMKVVFVISCILALGVGFQGDITNALAAARTIAFFPFFIAGYMMKTGNVIRIFDKKPVKALGALALVAALACIAYLLTHSDFTSGTLMMNAYHNPSDPLKRIIVFFIAAAMIFALYALLPERKIPVITKWGKNSLTIYLFHRIFPLLLLFVLPKQEYTDMYVAYVILPTLLILFLFGSDKINGLFDRFLNMIINAFTDDKKLPSSRKIRYTSLIILCLIMLYMFIDPILTSSAG